MESRNRAVSAINAADIHTCDLTSLMELQRLLRHGSIFGRWQSPRAWLPIADNCSTDIHLRRRIVYFLPIMYQQLVEKEDRISERAAFELNESQPRIDSPVRRLVNGAVETLTRYLILCRVAPVGIGPKGKGRPLDPSSIARIARSPMPRLLALGLEKHLSRVGSSWLGHGFLRHIEVSNLRQLPRAKYAELDVELKRVRMLCDQGLWIDGPDVDKAGISVTSVSGPFEPVEPERQIDPFRPLPDEYVGEMGRKSIWLIKELAPSLLSLGGEIARIWADSDDESLSPAGVAFRRNQALQDALSAHQWQNLLGQPISDPPFRLVGRNLGKGRVNSKRNRESDEGANQWKPKTFIHVIHLLKTLQMAHFFVVGLSMGARKSEIVTLDRECIQYAKDGIPYASGRTWKLVDRHDGAIREWVLPEMAILAIEQQVRLIRIVDQIGTARPKRGGRSMLSLEGAPKHLWAEIGGGRSNRTAALRNTSSALRSFARSIEMTPDPDDQGIAVHRFRKTVARLGALAITQAPKVLKDVFGHKSIEMTLYYILADENLQADIQKVARELRVMKAKESVEIIVAAEDEQDQKTYGGLGGQAAQMIDTAIKVHRDRLHRRGDIWGAESAYELAEILTLQGKAWQFVRPGVICTKFPGTEVGPCNKNKGAPEPARCQSHCRHRLEEAFLRGDVDASICEAVKAFNEAGDRGDELMQALWAAQVKVNINRFADIGRKWMGDASVRKIVQQAAEERAEIVVNGA